MKQKIVSTKIVVLIALLGALAFGGASYYLLRDNTDNTTQTEQTEQTEVETSEEEDQTEAESEIISNESPDPTAESEEPKESDNTSQSLQKPVISTAEQSGEQIIIRTVINTAKSGTCTLTLSKGSKTVTKKASVGLVTSYYTCQGFDVAKSELGSNSTGNWTAKVRLDSNGKTATSDPRVIEVE